MIEGALHRNRAVWWVASAVFWFLFLLTFGLAVNPSAPLAGRLAGFAISGCTLAWLVWAYRCGVRPGECVTVRQYRGRTVRIPWSNVAGFRVDRPMPMTGTGEWISVVLTDGGVVRTQGLCASRSGGRWAQDVIAELEAHRPTVYDSGMELNRRADPGPRRISTCLISS